MANIKKTVECPECGVWIKDLRTHCVLQHPNSKIANMNIDDYFEFLRIHKHNIVEDQYCE